MFPAFDDVGRMEVALYTDALVIRGMVRTRQRRVTDVLNLAEHAFLVLEDATAEELDGSGRPMAAEFAQVNLDSVLFAVANVPVESVPELRTRKTQAVALVAVPPFRMVGTIHLVPSEAGIRGGLMELTGRFVPVTEATYWSDSLGIPPREAILVAVNHRRTQILAQHRELGVDEPSADEPSVDDAPSGEQPTGE